MAITNSDGSIVLTTIVDPSGIKSFQSSLKKLAGSLAAAFSINQIVKFSNAAGQLATQTEASVQRLVDIYGSASDSVGDFIDANARALGMSKAAAASFSSVYGNLFSVWADQATNAELTNQYLQMTAVVASKTGRTVEDVQERIRSGLLGNTEAIEDLGVFVNVKTIEMTDAFQRMANGKSWEQLDNDTQQQIRSMAILEQATAKYGDEVADTSATIRNKFNAAYQDFQNSWGTIVNRVLLPILQLLTEILNVLSIGLNKISGITGQILGNTQGVSDNASSAADATEDQLKSTKKLNKEMKKTLAGFDELNTISSEISESTSDSAGGASNFGVGIGVEGSRLPSEIDPMIQAIMGIAASSFMAIGVILLYAGKLGWGIGFVIAGAAAFGITMETVDPEAINSAMQEQSDTLTILGVVLVACGILLCMIHQWGWGIAAILGGIGFIVKLVEVNWDAISTKLAEQSDKFAIVGGLLVVLGILLCLAHKWDWGIGAIAAGIVTIVTVATVNWDAIVENFKNFVFENSALIALISGGLLIIGILVCFVNLPLGIALIAAGAASLVTVVALNWDAIVDWVKGAWDAVKAFWNKYIAPIFTLEFWQNLAIRCGNGIIAGFEGAINAVITLFETMINWIVDGLNKISITVPDWVPGIGGKKFGFNIPRVDWGEVKIPRIPELARGAVIPGGKSFLAVLGDQPKGQTNVEAPLDTIKQAVLEVFSEVGGLGGFNGTIEVPVIINGREIARAVREAESDMGKQTVFGGFARAY